MYLLEFLNKTIQRMHLFEFYLV